MDKGLFVSFEGPEGAGKSTQARRLAAELTARGFDVLETREPGGTDLGEELRRLAKHLQGPAAPCPEAELFLMAASRAQLVRRVIRPHLDRGGVVVCDRFADSTTVYQGCARGLDLDFIQRLHRVATASCWPDLTVVLDLEPEMGLYRTRGRGNTGMPTDRFEAESLDFHRRVRDGFRTLAENEPGRVKLVSADRPIDEIEQQIMEIVTRALA